MVGAWPPTCSSFTVCLPPAFLVSSLNVMAAPPPNSSGVGAGGVEGLPSPSDMAFSDGGGMFNDDGLTASLAYPKLSCACHGELGELRELAREPPEWPSGSRGRSNPRAGRNQNPTRLSVRRQPQRTVIRL